MTGAYYTGQSYPGQSGANGDGLYPFGIPSGQAFGTAVLIYDQTVAPSGVASAEAFGTTVLIREGMILPTGIASAEALGTPAVLNLNQLLHPSSFRGDLGSGGDDVFGTPNIGLDLIIYPQPLQSAAEFGTPNFLYDQDVAPTAIASSEAFGSARVVYVLLGTGIATASTFGTARIRHRRAPANRWQKSSPAAAVWTPSDSN